MNLATRIIFAALLIAALQAAVYALSRESGPGDVRLPRRELRELPFRLGNWVGEDTQLDAKLANATGANQIVNRAYRSSTGEVVILHAGAWLDYRLAFPHPPESCYRGSGWQVSDQRNSTILVADEEKGPVRIFKARREDRRVQLCFWGHLGNGVVVDRDSVRRVRTGLRGHHEWPPLIKVLLQTSAENSERSEERLREFARHVFAWIDSFENK